MGMNGPFSIGRYGVEPGMGHRGAQSHLES